MIEVNGLSLSTVAEKFLLEHPAIDDCAVQLEEASCPPHLLTVYLVAHRIRNLSALRDALLEHLAGIEIRVSLVLVNRIPLTLTGAIDFEALSQLVVFRHDEFDSWIQELRTFSEIEHAAIVLSEKTTLADVLPLSRVLPDQTVMSASLAISSDKKTVDTAELTTVKACYKGDSLIVDAKSPSDLVTSLVNTAEAWPEKGIYYYEAAQAEEAYFQSYSELLYRARCVAQGLVRAGVKPGDIVILQLAALREYYTAFWGCLLCGAKALNVAVPPHYVADNNVVQKLYNTWKFLEYPVILTATTSSEYLQELTQLFEPHHLKQLDFTVISQATPISIPNQIDPQAIAFIQLSSGSTGIPKCIPETHQAVICHIHSAKLFASYHTDDVSLNWLPSDHVVPQLTCHLKDVYLACDQIQVATELVLADPLRWLDLIDKHRVTHTWSPNFGFQLLSLSLVMGHVRDWDLTCVKSFMNAGEQVTFQVLEEFYRLLSQYGLLEAAIRPAYGMAELATVVTMTRSFSLTKNTRYLSHEQVPTRFVDVGEPMPGVELRIVDMDNAVLPEGKAGRLQVRGPTVMAGYLYNTEANEQVFVEDGWFNTGDLGFFEQKHLVITGREKELIIINGVHYYCYELEDIVNTLPGVQVTWSAAIGVIDAITRAEVLAIFFVPQSEVLLDQIAVIREIKLRISTHFGVNPRYVLPLSFQDFPKTTSGKIQRTYLQREFQANKFKEIVEYVDVQLRNEYTLPNWFYERVWLKKTARPLLDIVVQESCLIFSDDAVLCAELLRKLVGMSCSVVVRGSYYQPLDSRLFMIDPHKEEHYFQLFEQLRLQGEWPKTIIHLWSYDAYHGELASLDALEDSQRTYLEGMLALLKALGQTNRAEEIVRLFWISSDSQPVFLEEALAYEKATIFGVLASAAEEMPWVKYRHIDFASAEELSLPTLLLTEVQDSHRETEVAYRRGKRWISAVRQRQLDVKESILSPIKKGGFYLISGGLGGIGRLLAQYLLSQFQATLLVIGRSELPPVEHRAYYLNQGGPLSDKIQALQNLQQLPGNIYYEVADCSDASAMQTVLSRYRRRGLPVLDGIFHLAGELQKKTIYELNIETLLNACQAKMAGSLVLQNLLEAENPEGLFVCFSSVNSFLANPGLAAYAAASRFIEYLCYFLHFNSRLKAYCLSWSMWQETGMSRHITFQEINRARGLHTIMPSQGVASLQAMLRYNWSHAIIGLDNQHSAIQQMSLIPVRNRQQLQIYYSLRLGQTEENTRSKLVTFARNLGYEESCEFTRLKVFPFTEQGEIDYQSLNEVGLQSVSLRGYQNFVPPRTVIEKQLTVQWAEVLNYSVDNIGIHDNFFSFGGNSIQATQIITRLNNDLKIMLTLRDLFEHPTIYLLGQFVEKAQSMVSMSTTPVLRKIDHEVSHPLSFAQQRLWFIGQLEPWGYAAYNIFYAFRLTGEVSFSALEKALNTLVQHHASLRTVFLLEGNEPKQWIKPFSPIHLTVELVEGESSDLLEAILHQERNVAFDLHNGPLYRFRLLKQRDNQHYLVIGMHHTISDGWSFKVFFTQLSGLYNAETLENSVLLPMSMDYVSYTHWQRQLFSENRLQEQVAYWKKQLQDLPILTLHTDYPRPLIQTYRGKSIVKTLPLSMSIRLRQFASQNNVTLYTVLFAAFNALIYRYTGQSDLVVGTPIAGRTRTELESILGLFVNSLVLRNSVEDNPSFQEFLLRCHETILDAHANQEVPFEHLVELLKPSRDASHNPLFQIMFAYQESSAQYLKLEGVLTEPLTIKHETSMFDLTLFATNSPNGIELLFEFAEDLFEQERMKNLARCYVRLLSQIINNPRLSLNQYALLSEEEYRKIVIDWNQTAGYFPRNKTIHYLFEEQVARTPTTIALISENRRMSYIELNKKANQVAHHLRHLGVGPNVIIGLCCERSIEMVVGMLGILKAGAAYLPIDKHNPFSRIDYMLGDSGVKHILCHRSIAKELQLEKLEKILIFMDESASWSEKNFNPLPAASPKDHAYLIYTSGSTGKPKGILITHEAVVNCLTSVKSAIEITCNDRFLATTSLSFDVAVLDYWLPFSVGAQVIVEDVFYPKEAEKFKRSLIDYQVTVMQATPSTWAALVDIGWLGHSHFKLLSAGEMLSKSLARELVSKGHLYNLYGPTETTIYASIEKIEDPDNCCIGKPIANVNVYVLDSAMNPVPVGVPGELYIGGVGVATGYINHPTLTEHCFVQNCFSKNSGERLYRTGDLVRWRSNEKLEFLGRFDDQVKIRGYRVEPTEIRDCLLQFPGVQQCAVVLRKLQGIGTGLVAYLVSEASVTLELRALRNYLRGFLPEYMLPEKFVMLNELPISPSGKLDTRRLVLPDLENELAVTETYQAPNNSIESTLVEVWKMLLNVNEISSTKNLFDLGAHSLLVVKAAGLLSERFDKTIRIIDFFTYSTIRAFADFLSKDAETQQEKTIERELERAEKQRAYQERRRKQHVIESMD